MFTSRGRARGRQGLGHRWWSRLSVHRLEGRIAPAQLVVTSSVDDGGAGTLRSIADIANTNGEADTITFDSSVTDITLVQGQVRLLENQPVIVNGPGSGKLTIRGNSPAPFINRIFDLPSGGAQPRMITISGMTLADTVTSANGAAINGGVINLFLDDVIFRDNVGSNSSTGNTANGAVNLSGNEMHLTVIGCQFIRNAASSTAGAIYVGAPNSASPISTVTISDTTFVDNSATYQAGAIYISGRTSLTVVRTTFVDNNSGQSGGAIYTGTNPFPTIIDDCVFANNHGGAGGAIASTSSDISIFKSTFENNSAEIGGALFINQPIAFVMERTTLANNTAWRAGGLYLNANFIGASPSYSIRQSTITDNNAIDPSTGGGGMEISTASSSNSANITIENSTIAGNTTRGISGGGGLWMSGTTWKGQLNIRNSTIVDNRAMFGPGGGISASTVAGSVTLSSTIVAQNKAANANDLFFTLQRNILGNDNLIGSLTNSNVLLTGANDPTLIGNDTAPVVPGLAGLAFYGGTTPTRPLVYTSPALDQGNNAFNYTDDQRGMARTMGLQTDIGATEGAITVPFIVSTTIADVNTAGGGVYSFSVTYDDETGIDTSTLDAANVSVIGPKPTGPISFKGFNTSGNRVTANYEFLPPGGTWDQFDNGTYTIQMGSTKIHDLDAPANELPTQLIGTVRVNIAGNYVVDNGGDSVDGNYGAGELTLREAVELSNVTLGVVDTINFASSLFGASVSLKATELVVVDPIIISGPGASVLSISGSNETSMFDFRVPGVGVSSVLSGLTLTNGWSQSGYGAIRISNAVVTLANMVITNNSAYGSAIGVSTKGAVHIIDSEITNNTVTRYGGAIEANSGSVIYIERTTIRNNTAQVGGGIYAAGSTATLIDSTVSNNSSSFGLGGGGIFISGGQTTIRNSTISGNQSTGDQGAAGIAVSGSAIVDVFNSTIANNVASGANGIGGVSVQNAVIAMNSTIVANNSNGAPSDIETTNTSGPVVMVKANQSLIGVANDPLVSITGNGNFIGSVTTPIDPLLGPLQNNGGLTATHALLPGSPAINSGSNPAGLLYDQRGVGFQRVYGKAADIGAFEFFLPTVVARLTVNDGSDQRSLVSSLQIQFDRPPVLPMNPSEAFQLQRQSDNALVGLNASVNGNVVTLTFNNGPVEFGSLADGRYSLTVFASKIASGLFDGNGDGVAGDDYVLVGTPANGLFRLFGDANGDGQVSAFDFNAFRLTYGTSSSVFDFNNDGVVSATDFQEFRMRYGMVI